MKEEILRIASDLREGEISSNQAKHLLLVLFGVVGRSEQLVCDCLMASIVGTPTNYICIGCGKPFNAN